MSATSEPCRCNYLAEQSREADGIIRFDESDNEYSFSSQGFSHRILYCPMCGGAAPDSRREEKFVRTTFEEESRIASLMEEICTLRGAQKLFGEPDEDGEAVHYYEDEQGKQTVKRVRNVVYKSVSPLADICITENQDGTISYLLQGKWIDTSTHFDWSTVPRHLHPDYMPLWKKIVLRTIGVKKAVNR